MVASLAATAAAAPHFSAWEPAQKLDEIASPADDLCPTPIRGGGLLFVSREALPGSCGMGDIYLTQFNPRHG